MTDRLREPFLHHAWATAALLEYCRTLDADTLAATVPGTYGTVLDTLAHLIYSDAKYLACLTGHWPGEPWSRPDSFTLDLLTTQSAATAQLWETALPTLDPAAACLWQAGGQAYHCLASTVLNQTLHHANEHRAQICTILGALGYQPPDLSGWDFAVATGQMRVVNETATR